MTPQHARHDPNQELMAQGIANFVTPFFGGIPATGTVARTVTNVRAGAATPVTGMVYAAALLAIVLVVIAIAGLWLRFAPCSASQIEALRIRGDLFSVALNY